MAHAGGGVATAEASEKQSCGSKQSDLWLKAEWFLAQSRVEVHSLGCSGYGARWAYESLE